MAKRIISIVAIVILVGMYIATLVSAALATPNSKSMFMGCLVLTVVVPIILWVFMALYKRAHANDDKDISLSEMRKYKKRIKKGESPEAIANEIEEKYNVNKDEQNL